MVIEIAKWEEPLTLYVLGYKKIFWYVEINHRIYNWTSEFQHRTKLFILRKQGSLHRDIKRVFFSVTDRHIWLSIYLNLQQYY